MSAKVSVPTVELRRALRVLTKVMKIERDRPVIIHAKGEGLCLEMVGTAAAMPFDGEWGVAVRVDPFWLREVLEVYQDFPLISFFRSLLIVRETDDLRQVLLVDGMELPCTLLPQVPSFAMLDKLPRYPDLPELVRLALMEDKEALVNAGLWSELAAAWDWLEHLVDTGFDLLAAKGKGDDRVQRWPLKQVKAAARQVSLAFGRGCRSLPLFPWAALSPLDWPDRLRGLD